MRWHELVAPLQQLTSLLARARFPLTGAAARRGGDEARDLEHQLKKYVLPRLQKPTGPLVAVVGGPTGAGKSTLVNSLAGEELSPAGVLRPTTRESALVCHPDDTSAFSEDQWPRRVTTDHVAPGLAFVDSPDIDSVVTANRASATQLLNAADVWLFVSTARRYADAIPWDLLLDAQARGVSLAFILNRIPPGASERVVPHLRAMLTAHGLGHVAFFAIAEGELVDGALPQAELESITQWCREIAESRVRRNAVMEATLRGVLGSVWPQITSIASVLDEQAAIVRDLVSSSASVYGAGLTRVLTGVERGELVQGEVLARWRESLSAGDMARVMRVRRGFWRALLSLFSRRARWRAAQRSDRLRAALGAGAGHLITTAITQATESAAIAWCAQPAGDALLHVQENELPRVAPPAVSDVDNIVCRWQQRVTEMVEGLALASSGAQSTFSADAVAVVVMVAALAPDAEQGAGQNTERGIDQGEAAGAADSCGRSVDRAARQTTNNSAVRDDASIGLLSRRVLTEVFAGERVRKLIEDARAGLVAGVEAFFDQQEAQFSALIEPVLAGIDTQLPERLRAAALVTETVRHRVLSDADAANAPTPTVCDSVAEEAS